MTDDGAAAATTVQDTCEPASAGPACSHLEHLLGANLLWFGRALNRRFDALLARRGGGLTMAQARILFTLDSTGAITQTDLAARTEVEPSTLGRTIDRMERQGLVKRRGNPTDRRQRVVELRAAGHRQLDQLVAFFEEIEAWLTRDLPDQRVRGLVGELTNLRERLTAEEGGANCAGEQDSPAAGADGR